MSEPVAVSAPQKPEPAFIPSVSVRSWKGVLFWRYRQAEGCNICHNNLQVPCIQCEAEPSHEACGIAWGSCGHSYHTHCIGRWTKLHSTCPTDNQEWDCVNVG